MYINQTDEVIRFEAQDFTRFDKCVEMIKSSIRRKSNSVIVEMKDVERFTIYPSYHVARFSFKVYENSESEKIKNMYMISDAVDECREWISADLGLGFSDYDVLSCQYINYDLYIDDFTIECEYIVTIHGEMRHGK